MAQTARVHISRIDEDSDKASLQFNEESSRLLGKKPLLFEQAPEGIFISVPQVDAPGAKKITFKKRVLEFDLDEEFVRGYYDVVQTSKDSFLIRIPWL